MELLNEHLTRRLLQNGNIRQILARDGRMAPDLIPVVKLVTPDDSCQCLLTELDPEMPELAAGIWTLGDGRPQGGHFHLPSFGDAAFERTGLSIVRVMNFAPTYTISVYAEAARRAGCITEDSAALKRAAIRLNNERSET